MHILRRFNFGLLTAVLASYLVLAPLWNAVTVSAQPAPAAAAAAACPAKLTDEFGDCICPQETTSLDCAALWGSWPQWVPDDGTCGTSSSSSSVSVDVNGGNVRAAFLYFIARGLAPSQSAGLVGNLIAESGVDPTINERNPTVPGSRGGFGIAQWTAGRRVAIENFATTSGKDVNSLQFQLDYLWDQELMKGYKTAVLDPLKQATSVEAASGIILHHFEIPGVILHGSALEVRNLEAYRASLGNGVINQFGGEAGAATATTGSSSCAAAGSGGFVGFPLQTTKTSMKSLNGSCFNDTTQEMCIAGHPYTAYDVMADTGTPVLSVMDGKVITITTDRCPGRMVSIYNEAQDVTISYLHMSVSRTIVKDGDTVTAGQNIGFVGTLTEGCVAPHLHIDAAAGQPRPGCSRLDCPAANASKFAAGNSKINLNKSLYQGYSKLPQ
jgi:hypothetical protein